MFKKIFLFLILSSVAFAQVVYEPLHRDVYSFLSRLSQKSVLVFDDQVRPVSRKYIAEKLIEVSAKSEQLHCSFSDAEKSCQGCNAQRHYRAAVLQVR